MVIKDLLQLTVDKNASDLHMLSGIPPYLRVEGVLFPISSETAFTPETIEKIAKEILTAEQLERLTVNKEIDFSLPFSQDARFRVNAYTQKGTMAIAFRRIPLEIPKINESRAEHIVTIEDPVEFIFKPINSIISQREMGFDTHSWQIALRSALREDPDVVLVGEMRDYETIASALTVAETGHLVFATLHTNSAAQTIDRIVDVFPDEQQEQVRLQLSNVIEAVFSMRLVPSVTGKRVVGFEVMLGTSAIKTAIREGKTHQIDNIIQTSTEVGMNTIEMSLANLVKSGKIDLKAAQTYSLRPEELNRLVRTSK